ncbi:MAG: hypothetical protein ACR2ME_06815 [Acidimicrobiia bacterium]
MTERIRNHQFIEAMGPARPLQAVATSAETVKAAAQVRSRVIPNLRPFRGSG